MRDVILYEISSSARRIDGDWVDIELRKSPVVLPAHRRAARGDLYSNHSLPVYCDGGVYFAVGPELRDVFDRLLEGRLSQFDAMVDEVNRANRRLDGMRKFWAMPWYRRVWRALRGEIKHA